MDLRQLEHYRASGAEMGSSSAPEVSVDLQVQEGSTNQPLATLERVADPRQTFSHLSRVDILAELRRQGAVPGEAELRSPAAVGAVPSPEVARQHAAALRQARDIVSYSQGVAVDEGAKKLTHQVISEQAAAERALASNVSAAEALYYRLSEALREIEIQDHKHLTQTLAAAEQTLSSAGTPEHKATLESLKAKRREGGAVFDLLLTKERAAEEVRLIELELTKVKQAHQERRALLNAEFAAALSGLNLAEGSSADSLRRKLMSSWREVEQANRSRFSQAHLIQAHENIIDYIRQGMASLHKVRELDVVADVEAMQARDVANRKKKHPLRDKVLLGLLAFTLSSGVTFEGKRNLDLLRDRIEELKNKQTKRAKREQHSPKDRMPVAPPHSYVPQTGGSSGEPVPLNIHPDSALTMRESDKGQVWRSGLYQVEGQQFTPLTMPVTTEVADRAVTHDIAVEPLGSSEVTVPLAPGTALNPHFNVAGITVEQYLGHLTLKLSSEQAKQESILLPKLLIELGASGKLHAQALPDEFLRPQPIENSSIAQPIQSLQELAEQHPGVKNFSGAEERFQALAQLYTDLDAVWQNKSFDSWSKNRHALELVQQFSQSSLFLYNASEEQQKIDEVLMNEYKLLDQDQAHLILGKLDCDRAAKLGLDILATSQARALAQGHLTPNEVVPALALIGFVKNPSSWQLEQPVPHQPRMGNIDGENTAHGIATLVKVNPDGTVEPFYYDMTPTTLDPDYRASEPNSPEVSSLEQLRHAMAAPEFQLVELPKDQAQLEAYTRALGSLTKTLDSFVEIRELGSLPEAEQVRLLELADKQSQLLENLVSTCHAKDATLEDRLRVLVNLNVLQKISVGLRPEAYASLQPKIIDVLNDESFVPSLLVESAGADYGTVLEIEYGLKTLIESESYSGESARDGYYQERDQALLKAFRRVDVEVTDVFKKVEIFTQSLSFVSLRNYAQQSATADWLEQRCFELFQQDEVKALPDYTKKFDDFLNGYSPQFFNGKDYNLSPEQTKIFNTRNTERCYTYAREALKLFPLGQTTSDSIKQQAIEMLNSRAGISGAYDRPVILDLPEQIHPEGGYADLAIGPTICTEIRRDITPEFNGLKSSEEEIVVKLMLATALHGSADDVVRAQTRGAEHYLRFDPLDREAKVRGAQFYRIYSILEKTMLSLSDYFASERGHRYLEEHYRGFVPVPKNTDFPKPIGTPAATKTVQRNIDHEFAVNMVDGVMQEFFEPQQRGKVDGLVRNHMVKMIEQQVVKVKGEMSGRAERARPQKDW